MKLDMARWPDGNGVYFDEARGYALLLKPKFQMHFVEDAGLRRQYIEQHPMCNWCGRSRGERSVHHIFGGTKGRFDNYSNYFTVCDGILGDCHRRVQSEANLLGRVLYMRWMHDRFSVDWVFLTLLRGSTLPDLDPVK